MPSNCGAGEDSWKRVTWTARSSNQSILQEISPEYSLEGLMLKLKLQLTNTLATWCKEVIHWKRPWCWGRLKAGEEGDNRGWDGWMASPTQLTWVWVNSGSWCWTGRRIVLWSMGSQRVGHNWVTELNWDGYQRQIWEIKNLGGSTHRGALYSCEFYWQELDQFPTVNTWEKSPPAFGKRRGKATILKHTGALFSS